MDAWLGAGSINLLQCRLGAGPGFQGNFDTTPGQSCRESDLVSCQLPIRGVMSVMTNVLGWSGESLQ